METTAAIISMAGPAPASAAVYGQTTGVWNPRNLAEIEIFAGTGTVKRYRHHDGPPPALSLTTHDGAEVQHVSGAVTTNHATPAAIAAMVGVAHAQGWASVELTGGDEFKLAAAEQLMRRGIQISNPEMRASLDAIRRRLDEEAAQALAAQVRAQAASITPAHQVNAHQAEVQAYFAARKEAGELWHKSGDTPAFRDAQSRRNAAAAALDQARTIPPEAATDVERLRGFAADVLCARGTSRAEAERTAKGLKGAVDTALLLGFDLEAKPAPTLNLVAPTKVAEKPVAIDEEPPLPTLKEIEEAAVRAAANAELDGAMTYRARVELYKVANESTGDLNQRKYYIDILDADERGYGWSDEVRAHLAKAGQAIEAGRHDDAQEHLYDAWTSIAPEEYDLISRYN